MDSERIPSHAFGVTAWVSERTTRNKLLPCMESRHRRDYTKVQGASNALAAENKGGLTSL